MSLVMTPRLSSWPSWAQISAIRELLPVPTGPATPSRSARRGSSPPDASAPAASGWSWLWSGTIEPPLGCGVGLAPRLDHRCAARRELLDGPQLGDAHHQ